MRVLILGDMEGVAGVCRWEHVLADKPLYEEGRHLYTVELNAAIRAAKDAGATEITVVDTHGAGEARNFNSVVLENLEAGCRYFTQNRWLDFEELLKRGCQAAVIIGMHAMAGTPDGVLAHTVCCNIWKELTINGKAVGETAILAALCARYDCPTVFVSGDEAACREATELFGDQIGTAAVKTGFGAFTALHLRPKDSARVIETRVTEALQQPSRVLLYRPPEPCTIEVQLTTPEVASAYQRLPGVEQSGPCGITVTADNWYAAWKVFFN